LRKNFSKDEIDQHIIQIVKEKKPENIKLLVKLIQEKFPLSDQEILDHILDLQENEQIRFKPNQTLTPQKLTDYLRSSQAYWYWITIIITSTTALLVFAIPEDAFPQVYARYVLGIIFVLWLPGYAFIKALFPQTLPFTRGLAHSLGTTEKNLDTIERVALSLGMSIALVPIVGLLLNYTPWGIRLTPIVLSLTTLTLAFATTAIAREYQIRIKQDASRILIPASQKS